MIQPNWIAIRYYPRKVRRKAAENVVFWYDNDDDEDDDDMEENGKGETEPHGVKEWGMYAELYSIYNTMQYNTKLEGTRELLIVTTRDWNDGRRSLKNVEVRCHWDGYAASFSFNSHSENVTMAQVDFTLRWLRKGKT